MTGQPPPPGAGEPDSAAVVLSLDLDVCRSILRGVPVRAGRLDAVVLRRALRGEPLPSADVYLAVDDDMLAAVVEAAPLPRKAKR